MNKIFKYLTVFIISGLVFSPTISAKTLGDLKDNLKKEEEELINANKKQTLTEQERQAVSNNITKINNTIKQTYKDIDNLEAEIAQLNLDIKEKEEQIKEIINFNQVSNGDDTYLEYIFGAKDFTDFIYRSAITEQLASYNDKLVDEFNRNIKLNQKKQKQIAEKRESLKIQQKNLEKEYAKLGDELNNIADEKLDTKEQIKYLREMIQIYKEKGCKDNENIATCGKNILPSTTSFLRPLTKGYVTSEYGGSHIGIDNSVSPNKNVKVYASAAGIVSGISWRTSCGGTMIFVHHKTTKGKTYTTIYMHMKSVNVKKGQTVTRDTVLGIMGGGPDTWGYDSCTTGAHVHFTIATGLYGADYTTWSQLRSRTLNPRGIVNYPSGRYNWFQDRWSAY